MRLKSLRQCLSFLVAMIMALTLMCVTAFAATENILDGQVSVADSANSISVSGGTVTITAKGSLFSKKTNDITITNETANKANLSFDYTASTYNSFQVAGVDASASGTYTVMLDAEGTLSIKLVSNSGLSNTTASLILSNFKLTAAAASSKITFHYDSNYGGITVDGVAMAHNGTADISADGAKLVATVKNGGKFLGWVDEADGRVLSTNASDFTLQPAADMTVKAVFVNAASEGWFLTGGQYLFNDLNKAGEKAGTLANKTVVLMNNATLPAGTYTIPSGVTLLIPYNDANTLRGALVEDTINRDVPAGVVDWENRNNTLDSEYRRLTMSSGSSLTVKGALEVGSMTHPMAKGQFGPYGLIQMDAGSSITVNAGAELFAWGYIRGSGTVTVNSNAVVYENFDATDYPGSAGNMDELNQAEVFAMKEYSLNNVEVEMTVNAGATVKGAICIYGNLIQYNTFVKTFVGNSESDMIQLTSGTLKKSYVSSRQKFVLDGEAKVNPFNITITYIISYKVDSSQTSGLPFPSNWDFTVSSGSMVPNDSILLLAGATVTINEGASIVIPSGKNVYVFDAAEDPKGAGRNDAKVDVNGTVTVNGAFYTTESGANITSSLGGGSVVCAASGTATTVKLKNGSSTAGTYNITPAKLKNGDGTYTETAGAAATYTYCGECGFWETHEEPVAKIVGGSSEGIRKHYHSLQDAVDDYTSGTGYVQMVAASGADCDINKAVYLDLNGKTVTGVSVTGTLHGIDSATNGFGDAVGYIQLTNGSAEKVAANPVDAKDNYVAVTKDGKTTFNRFDIPVTDYYLEIDADGNAKVGFAAAFRGNAAAASALEDMGFIINGDATPLWGTANSLELSKVTDKYRIFYTYPTTNWEEHSALGVVKYGGVTYKGDEQATAFNFTEILDNYEGAGQDVITAFWEAVEAAKEETT